MPACLCPKFYARHSKPLGRSSDPTRAPAVRCGGLLWPRTVRRLTTRWRPRSPPKPSLIPGATDLFGRSQDAHRRRAPPIFDWWRGGFWSNRFSISADKIQSMAGAYAREAFRPDWAASSTCYRRWRATRRCCSTSTTRPRWVPTPCGRNEKLAREILELHTLGVRAGYSQDDVINLPTPSPAGPFSRPATIPITAASSRSTDGCASRAEPGCCVR